MKIVDIGVKADANRAIVWQDDQLYLLDQRVLPHTERYLLCETVRDTADAIREMVVRGAPAIGITAAFGVVLAAREAYQRSNTAWSNALRLDLELLAAARPTAINLFWAIERMSNRVAGLATGDPVPALREEAKRIHKEDIAANRHMGRLGAELFTGTTSVITHCNTGGLATGGHGTALGVIRTAHARGLVERVYADETRPWLQGARLTAWELARDKIPVSLMVDGAAAARMRTGGVGWAIVGSDRIAANGDVANKIGTYSLAVAARHHGVKFMVVAPTSTVDMGVASGNDIPIEARAPEEVLMCAGQRVGAMDVDAWNPVFDVTPAELVDAIVTERGVVLRPDAEKMAALMGD